MQFLSPGLLSRDSTTIFQTTLLTEVTVTFPKAVQSLDIYTYIYVQYKIKKIVTLNIIMESFLYAVFV